MTYRLTEWGQTRAPVSGVEPWGEMTDDEYRRLCQRFPWLPERGYFEHVEDAEPDTEPEAAEEPTIDDDSAEPDEVIGGRAPRRTRRPRWEAQAIDTTEEE